MSAPKAKRQKGLDGNPTSQTWQVDTEGAEPLTDEPQEETREDGPEEEDEVAPPYPEVPAKTYPFVLDTFQKDSISWLEVGHSVMVSAHTSAGKTVVAEYAIARCLRDGKRVIYTSPIKALSNQKYRDLSMEFGDKVGLMTGDVSINPSADCLVMTTEILRGMLFRGNEMLREVGCVIFDEIHYLRDKVRGVIWEETIIMLPHRVQYVFLSATIPNAKEFSDWVMRVHPKGEKMHVIYTDYRPTPLQHFIFPAGGEGIFCVVDDKGEWRDDNFKKAMASVTDPAAKAAAFSEGGAVDASGKQASFKGKAKGMAAKQAQQRASIINLVKMVRARELAPAIVFSFSKRQCEDLAMQLSNIDFNTEEEKGLVTEIFNSAIEPLAEHDKQLGQIHHLLPLLKRGIGIHHSGLLPLMKEVVEILFQENLVKILFSTETFSMGLNMPARTVIFTSAKKFDGTSERFITSGEYIQMSGRAGRRGLDQFGVTILMIDEKVDPDVVKVMTSGKADRLDSAFRLTFNMVLNLLRVEEINPEYVMERSFAQFQSQRNMPELKRLQQELKGKLLEAPMPGEAVSAYYNQKEQVEKLRVRVQASIVQPGKILRFLNPGRLLWIRRPSDGVDYGWGACVGFHFRAGATNVKPTASDGEGSAVDYTVDVAVHTEQGPKWFANPPLDISNPDGQITVVSFPLEAIQGLSALKLPLPDDLSTPHRPKVRELKDNLYKIQAQFKDKMEMLDIEKHLGIKDERIVKAHKRMIKLKERLEQSPVHNTTDPEMLVGLEQMAARAELQKEFDATEAKINDASRVILRDTLKGMRRVLRRLDYTGSEDLIKEKGRVACEITSADEIILTDYIFSGLFADTKPEEIAALLSCMVAEAKDTDEQPDPIFADTIKKMKEKGSKIIAACMEAGVPCERDHKNVISTALLKATHAWVKGSTFKEVCDMTTDNVYEGNIIRCFKQLEELLRQMAGGARALGDEGLALKFLAAQKLLRKDIVFAASLYL